MTYHGALGIVATMASTDREEALILVESLRNMLTSFACGGSSDSSLYVKARSMLLNDPALAKLTPRWLKSCRHTGDFWGMIKQKFAHYAERREWLRTEFEPIFEVLEGSNARPADATSSDQLRKLGSAYVQESWQKALDRRIDDPDGALRLRPVHRNHYRADAA